MCGISGIVGTGLGDLEVRLSRMSGALQHRGPDAEGSYIANFDGERRQIGLAHRRLAIIDLNPASNQPMFSEDGRLILVFNGEIYNYIELREELIALGHRFLTGSDTEVILKAYMQWELGMMDRLSGMFAFALFDHRSSRLILARDPFGKKPLYLTQSGESLAFASEVTALLAANAKTPEIDPAAVRDYLLWRYVPAPATMFKGIWKLAPGSYAVWTQGRLTETRYYTPPDQADISEKIDPVEAEERFLALLDRSVEIQMRSDAPFGAFLSGGLDSSAVVSLMAEHATKQLRTYSVGFEAPFASELPFARRVAQHFKTDHTDVVVGANDMIDNLDKLVRHHGGPISQSSDVPIYLMSRQAYQDVKMVLTGEGADEILAGYPKHRAEPLAGIYRTLVPSSVHQKVVAPLLQAIPSRSGRTRTFARTAGERDFAARMIYWFGASNHAEVNALFGSAGAHRDHRKDFAFSSDPGQSHLRRVLFFDQTSWLPDNLLERADRMMMAGSLEGRMPFLDKDLVAFVSRLPDHHRLGPRHGKQILRKVMADRLPREVLSRRKVGFAVPVADWFRGAMKTYLADHLSSSQSVVRSYLDGRTIDYLLAQHHRGEANHEKSIWALLNLEIFHRQFALGTP